MKADVFASEISKLFPRGVSLWFTQCHEGRANILNNLCEHKHDTIMPINQWFTNISKPNVNDGDIIVFHCTAINYWQMDFSGARGGIMFVFYERQTSAVSHRILCSSWRHLQSTIYCIGYPTAIKTSREFVRQSILSILQLAPTLSLTWHMPHESPILFICAVVVVLGYGHTLHIYTQILKLKSKN